MASPSEQPRPEQPRSLIIDTDPGVDDALAILMALAQPGCNVVGITTTAGNVPLSDATRNTLALLEYAGRADIPVYRGAARPVQGRFAYARHVHSATGLTYPLPKPETPARDGAAVPFLNRALRASPGRLTVVALGPLTNLTRLHRRHPGALARAERIVVMGGAVETAGNATPHAEFNFYSDPTAAREIMESGLPITLIDLRACRQVFFSRQEAETVHSADRLGILAINLLRGWFDSDPARTGFHLYDPLAMLALSHPEVLRLQSVTMSVEDSTTSEDPQRWGKCNIVAAGGGPISVAAPDGVNSAAALAAIRELLSWQIRG